MSARTKKIGERLLLDDRTKNYRVSGFRRRIGGVQVAAAPFSKPDSTVGSRFALQN